MIVLNPQWPCQLYKQHYERLFSRFNDVMIGDYQLRNQLRGALARSANPCAQGAQSYRGRDGRRYFCY